MTHTQINIFKTSRTLMLLLFLVLLIVHFIIKDRLPYLSVIFYACPLPLIIIFGFFLVLIFYKIKVVLYGLLTLLLGLTIYFFTHYFGSENQNISSAQKSHILFWNVAKSDPLPTVFLIKTIKQFRPDIIAMVEARDISDEDLAILHDALPNYQFKTLQAEMMIGIKGNIEDIIFKMEEKFYKVNYITATINRKTRHILISDVDSDPFINRKIPLSNIYEFTKKHEVDFVVGDFNTPYESVYFDQFKPDFKSFHPYSIGMTSTWPRPMPVIEIDNIWINKQYNPIKLQKICTNFSRHKLLIAEYQ